MKKIFTIFLVFTLSFGAFAQKGPAGGQKEKNEIPVKFYPNPASVFITFDFGQSVQKGTSLQVYSFLGRKVLHIPVSESRIQLNITDLLKGVYIFQLVDLTGRVLASNKFQVAR